MPVDPRAAEIDHRPPRLTQEAERARDGFRAQPGSLHQARAARVARRAQRVVHGRELVAVHVELAVEERHPAGGVSRPVVVGPAAQPEREGRVAQVAHVERGQPMPGEEQVHALGHRQETLEHEEAPSSPSSDRLRLVALVHRRQLDGVLPGLEDHLRPLAGTQLEAQRARRRARFVATQEAQDGEEVDGLQTKAREPHAHHALDLEETLHPRSRELDLLLFVSALARKDGEALGVHVEARAPVGAHAVHVPGERRGEVDVRRAALEGVDAPEEVVFDREAPVAALVFAEGLE